MNFPPHKCGLYLTHNEHRDDYQEIAEFIRDHDLGEKFESEAMCRKAIETDELWDLQWYPLTPIGFYRVVAPTLEDALRRAAEIATEIAKQTKQ